MVGFELAVNLKTAKALGINIPETIWCADEASNEKAANLALGVAPSGNDLSIYCVCATFVRNVTKSH